LQLVREARCQFWCQFAKNFCAPIA
jgi:hypothetical protein